MSAGGPQSVSGRGLRLVSDEGRTVAEPPERTVPEPPPSQPDSGPPPHPSMPARNGHSSNGTTGTPNGLAEIAADLLNGERQLNGSRAVDDQEFYAAIEAVLIVATEPVPADVLASVTAAPIASVAVICDELAAEYAAAGRGFTVSYESPAATRCSRRPPARNMSSGSSAAGVLGGCLLQPWRRWRWWPTSSRSPEHRSAPSVA